MRAGDRSHFGEYRVRRRRRRAGAVSSPIPQPNSEATPTPLAHPERSRWIPWRAMLLALLLAPLTAYWTSDQIVDVIFSLMVPPVMMTLLVAILNLGARRFAPRLA